MRRTTGFIVAFAASAAIVPAQPLHAQVAGNAGQLRVHVENPLAITRHDEVIAIGWPTLQHNLPRVTPQSVRVIDVHGVEQVSQVVDADADGVPDELLFQTSLLPSERREFRIEARAPTSQQRPRAHVRYEAHRDDVAWENDRIAFRIYGQGLWNAPQYQPLVSSGIDVWLKRVRDLIVDRWYEKGHDAYHIDTGEGADFYTVGESLGAGGSAIWRHGTLHRAKNFRSHRIIATGPIRIIFELQYDAWDAAGIEVTETKRITMDAGHNLYLQEITYRATGVTELEYAVGTVKRAELIGSTNRSQPWVWQSTWGPVERKNGGHGSLGTAVIMERDRVIEMRETDDHYLVIARARPGEKIRQYVGAGWTASGDFSDVSAWWSYIDGFAARVRQPPRVSLSEVAGDR